MNQKRIINLLLNLFFATGWGISLHAVANELYWKTCDYTEILKIQGEYIGLTIILIAYIATRLMVVEK